jgi:mRNA interferase RelE/StbE
VKVDFKKSFTKDLKKVRNKELLQQVKKAIEQVEQASNLQALSNLKQLRGQSSYFRIRLAEYRIGIKIEGDLVIFVRFLHRKEIYRYFP